MLQYSLVDILVYSFQRNWPDIPGFFAVRSVSELSGRRLYMLRGTKEHTMYCVKDSVVTVTEDLIRI